ncbi:MAG: hypothetical protein AAFU59_08020 [Pseudomonadota bacterium]
MLTVRGRRSYSKPTFDRVQQAGKPGPLAQRLHWAREGWGVGLSGGAAPDPATVN